MALALTVSHICNLICFPSIVIIRAPNSTPKLVKIVSQATKPTVELPIVKS